jgi:membrane fusion protein (multidrug efflux system)
MKTNTGVESRIKSDDLAPSPASEPTLLKEGDSEHRPEIQPDGDESQPDGETTVEAETKQSFFNRHRWLLAVVGASALTFGAVSGWRWWQFIHTHVSTDNAQIEGHISPVAPKISATVQKVLVKDGELVKAGQTLVILQDEDLQLKIQQNEANLNAAKAQLKSSADTGSLTANTNTTQIQQAESNLAAQQAGVVAAETNVKQAESEIKAAEAQLQQAELGVSAAKSQLEGALAGVEAQKARIRQAESGVSAARAKVVQAETEVNKTKTDLQRYEYLFGQGAIPAQQQDTARAAFNSARANLTVANEGVGQAEAQVNDARAQLQQAQAQVKSVQSQLQQAQAQVDSARARLQQAEAQVDNSRAQVQKSIAEADASRSQVAETKASTQKVVVQQDQTESAQAQVKEAEAALALARQQLEYTVIKAPVSGYVGQLTGEVGQKVQPGQPLLAVVPLQTEEIYVRANFKETELKDLRVGEPAEVRVDAYPGEVFRAKVEGLSPATGAQFALLPPDNATGNFNKVVQWLPVRLTFLPDADPQHKLRAGLSVYVTVNTAAVEKGQ